MMDRYFHQALQGRVDMSQDIWRFSSWENNERNMVSDGQQSLLAAFRKGYQIQDIFFPNRASTVSLGMTVRLLHADKRIRSIYMNISGQPFKAFPGTTTAQHILWPGSGKTYQLWIELALDNQETLSWLISGHWALFRFMDQASTVKVNPDGSMDVTWLRQGLGFTLQLLPDSRLSPFPLPEFTCPQG